MTRALSVAEGKGEVNWVASQAISEDGRLCLGNREAWSSAAEKSLHLRHEFCADGFGFDAMMADRFGRDAVGMGGGTRDNGGVLSDGLVLGMGGGLSVDEFMPNVRAEGRTDGGGGVGRAVGGGGTGLALWICSRSGLLDGLDGN